MRMKFGPDLPAATWLFGFLAATAIAGCAHTPVNRIGCNLPLERLEVEQPRPEFAPASVPATTEIAQPNTYEAIIQAAMAPPPPPPPPQPGEVGAEAIAPRPVSLFLSGGSQNGAFGAGFLDAWRQGAGGQLPPFRFVTGISTGALIGSAVFTGASDRAVAGYTINSESDLYDVQARGLVAQVKKGAAGNLAPLRQKIDDLLDDSPGDDAVLGRVAAAYAETPRRYFLVGVVDARKGEAFTVDMTALAARWQAAAPADRDAIKQCYLDPLIASSSVPLAAPPIYIDGNMYVDGGLRFGVFRAAEANAMASVRALATQVNSPPPVSFLIVNGRLDIKPNCPFEIPAGAQCPDAGTLKKWNVLDLAFRSIDILTNQNQRFSARETDADFAARINPDAPDHPFEGKTCAEWRLQDEADDPPPLQFHKREMRCLIDYGRTQGLAAMWWTKY